MPIRFAETGPTTIRIGGIYQSNALILSYLVSSAYFLAHFRAPHPGAVLVRTNGNPGAETAVTNALAPYGNVQVQTRAQFEQAQVSAVNKLLGLVYALLALAVLIALIGIVNTLMLSVLERTREIGLLRAVGMRRRQVRSMIRSEAVILATFGALIGIVIGTLMGLALVSVAAAAEHQRDLRSLGAAGGVPCLGGASSGSWPRAGPPGARPGSTSLPPSRLSEPTMEPRNRSG